MISSDKKRNSENINNRDIGQRIREERERLGLSRSEFAEIVELSDYYIGQLERGERQMSLTVLIKISTCLHISLDYLIFGSTRYDNNVYDQGAPAYTNEKTDIHVAEIMQLLEKCSDKELTLFKKVIQTIIPYVTKAEK
jgi:transcriptional regulator with XRE-family HTH domain